MVTSSSANTSNSLSHTVLLEMYSNNNNNDTNNKQQQQEHDTATASTAPTYDVEVDYYHHDEQEQEQHQQQHQENEAAAEAEEEGVEQILEQSHSEGQRLSSIFSSLSSIFLSVSPSQLDLSKFPLPEITSQSFSCTGSGSNSPTISTRTCHDEDATSSATTSKMKAHNHYDPENYMYYDCDATSSSDELLTYSSELHGTQNTEPTHVIDDSEVEEEDVDDDIEQPKSTTSRSTSSTSSSKKSIPTTTHIEHVPRSSPTAAAAASSESSSSSSPQAVVVPRPPLLRRKSSYHYKKYMSYACKVESRENDKATELKFFNCSRPHMRAFYCAWWSFLIGYVNWFAIAPLLPEVRDSLQLTRQQIWTSSIASIPLATILRLTLGSICDKYGARYVIMWVLMAASIPTACTGFVQSAVGLSMVRLFSGIGGSAFVMTQFWANAMFSKSIVGSASSLVGNSVEVGVTQLFMGSIIFPLFKNTFLGPNGTADQAWRWSTVVPAIMTFITGIVVYHSSDDTPKGNYKDLKKQEFMSPISASKSFHRGIRNRNAWLLFVQYACCMGLELTMNNAASLYFKDEFGQSTETAAAIASVYGWVAPIGTFLGGYLSDTLNYHWGLNGRLMAQLFGGIIMGILVLIFAQLHTLTPSLILFATISIAQKAAVSFTFSIVPYVDPPRTGTIAGIVAAGAGFGAIIFGLGFRQLARYDDAFRLIGGTSILASVLTFGIRISGSRGGGLCGPSPTTITTTTTMKKGANIIGGGGNGLQSGFPTSTISHGGEHKDMLLRLGGSLTTSSSSPNNPNNIKNNKFHHNNYNNHSSSPHHHHENDILAHVVSDNLSELEWYEEADASAHASIQFDLPHTEMMNDDNDDEEEEDVVDRNDQPLPNIRIIDLSSSSSSSPSTSKSHEEKHDDDVPRQDTTCHLEVLHVNDGGSGSSSNGSSGGDDDFNSTDQGEEGYECWSKASF